MTKNAKIIFKKCADRYHVLVLRDIGDILYRFL